MAYLLRAQNGQYITLPSGFVIGSNDDFSIKIVAEPSQNSDFYRPLGGSDFNDSAPRILVFGGGRSRITTGGGTNLDWFPSFDISTIKEIEFRRVSGTLEYLVDGVVISGWTRAGDTSSFNEFSVINANFGATTAYQCDYKLIEFEINGVVTNRYDPSASGGTGSTLIDTVSGNNGTLVNFPTDDSQWVFFDDGGGSTVTADVGFTVSAPTASVSASATLPAPSSDVTFTVNTPTASVNTSATLPQPSADVSYSVSIPAVAASVDVSLPQPLSDISFTVNAPSVAANASATIPGYNASVSFAVNTPSVSADASVTLPNPTANIDYTVSAPSISAGIAASLPQPDSDIVFIANAPSVSATASATQTGWNAEVNIAVNAPIVSISASATLPRPDSTVSFAVSPPQVSVVAIVGGIAIIVDDETNINQRVLSNNINAPILSNNING